MKNIIITSLLVLLLCTSRLFAQGPEPVRVGVFLDMTGLTSSFGMPTLNGIKLAVKEINARGGVNGRRIELFIEDNKGQPEIAKEMAKNLIAIQKVHALIGDVPSTNSLAAAPEAQSAQIPMITPSSTSPRVTQVGDYIFRVCFIDPYQGKAMARFAYSNLRLKRIAIFRDVNSDYSRGLASNFEAAFKKLGGTILTDEVYSQIDADFKVQLRRIRRTKPDAINIPGYYGQVGIIAKQARQLGMNMPLLGGDGWDSPELWKLGGRWRKNSYVTGHFAVDDPAAEVQKFVERYTSEFDSEPDTLSALGYDAVNVLAAGIDRAGSTDGPKLRNALAETNNFVGVTGKTSFSLARNAIKPAVIFRLDEKERKFVYHLTIQPE